MKIQKIKWRSLTWALWSFFLVVGLILPGGPMEPLFAQKSSESSELLSADAFLVSEAGKAFSNGEFEKALGATNRLLEKHPHDSLVVRYKAIALDRLGRSDEAIAIFKDLLSENPTHIPTRYFLAQAYVRSGRRDLAVEEWKQIAGAGEGTPYEAWARSALARTGRITSPRGRQAARDPQRWNVYFRYGYEYDSNVTLKPNDKSLASSRDQNAGRQTLDLSIRYRAYSERDLAVDLLYTARQTIHDDSLNEFNFHSEEFGLNVRKRLQMGSQDVIAGVRYDVLVGFLEKDLFSVRNRWNFSADTRFTPRSRTVFFDRMTVANYGPDGTEGEETSRDGFYNDAGLTHYIYTPDFKKHVFISGELNSSNTSGDNFDAMGATTRVGFYAPLLERLDLNGSAGLKLRFYSDFDSISPLDTSKRRDINWDLYGALTYHLTPRLGLRGFYRYMDNDNRNNFYDSNRHISGGHLIYSQSF